MLCLGALSAIYLPIYQTSATPSSEKIAISTNSSRSFINIENMVPGDKITKSLQVINEGNVDFNYKLSVEMESGDQVLFDNLKVTITDKDKDIYNGSIKELNTLNLGELLSFKKNDLLFTVELPKVVGNDVKNKTTVIGFNFVAEGLNESENASGNGNNLPNTATNHFNFLLAGALLLLGGSSILIYVTRKSRIKI